MIFTIGNKSSYDQALREEPSPRKWGQRAPSKEDPDGYPGGLVFCTETEARAFIAAGCMDRSLPIPGVTWEVYGLLTDWETGTYITPSGERALLKDTQFIALDKE